jgi:1-acyl-sn-glycerol-3-phosphate acyltransferase
MTRPSPDPQPTPTPAPAAAPVATAASPSSAVPPPPGNALLYRFMRFLCLVTCIVYFRLRVYGLEHVPRTGGFLLISNHQSMLDPVLIGVRMPRFVSYMARATLFKNRFFGWFIRNLNAFPVEQGKADTGAVKEAIARLKAGHVLTMFPEGHRTLDGELQPIQAGVALVIRRAGVPIVPVVVDGAYQAWPKGGHNKLPRFVPVRVLYGPPLKADGLKADQITALIDRTFRDLLDDLRRR